MLLFESAYTVLMDPPVVYSLIFTLHLSFLQPVIRDYSRLSFDYITYSANNTSERCVFVIYRHKDKCNSLICYFFHRIKYIFRTKQGGCF